MIDFLNKRRRQVESRRAGVEEQERQRAAKIAQLKTHIALLKDLLRDARYLPYVALLQETKTSLLAEREALLAAEDDRDRRDHLVTLLTGRIMQLDFILTTPDQFLALADEPETPMGNRPVVPETSAARSPAREPVGSREET